VNGLEHASEILSRDTPGLAAAWRERCAETCPGSPPSPSVARAFVAAVADALRAVEHDSPEVLAVLHAPLEFDHDAAISVEQMAAFREILHHHLLTSLPGEEALEAVESLSRLVDVLLVAVTERAFRRLEAAAFLDPLTGVGNRRALDRDAVLLLATAQRHGRPLSVMVIDLDGLKSVNDSQGHAAGDETIKRLATTLSRHLRSGDAVYRVGGDEFVLVLPETKPADVGPFLQRAVAQAPSFTYGVAGFPDDGLGLEQLVDAADQKLLDHRRRSRGGDGGRRLSPGQSRPARQTPPVDRRPEETSGNRRPTSSPSGGPLVRRIASMPWPEREIEERLYEIADVLAARVSDEGAGLHVGVLVRPTTDREALPEAILDRIQSVAGAVPETLDLRVMPLGSTAETRVLQPGGPASAGGPEARSSATPSTSAPSTSPTGRDESARARVGPAVSSPGSATPPATGRIVLTKVTSIQEGSSFAAEVELRRGDQTVSMRNEGVATTAGTDRLIADATALALDELDPTGRRRGIEFVEILSSAVGDVAVVGVVIAGPAGAQLVTGSASVRNGNRLDALARAVLDATNRLG
jgi:diguanylate cyclase (GGDEF)-like protein